MVGTLEGAEARIGRRGTFFVCHVSGVLLSDRVGIAMLHTTWLFLRDAVGNATKYKDKCTLMNKYFTLCISHSYINTSKNFSFSISLHRG